MRIRIERNPDFWRDLADHPSCVHVKRGYDVDIGELVEKAGFTPFATDNGGWIFETLDHYGAVFEIHALYRLEGRGLEANECLKAALAHMNPALVIVHQDDNPMSSPPKSFGFRPCGSTRQVPVIGEVSTWFLTRSAWEASPARRRMLKWLS